MTGLLLGLNANAPLREKLSLYGNFAFRACPGKSNLPDGNGRKKVEWLYWIGEGRAILSVARTGREYEPRVE